MCIQGVSTFSNPKFGNVKSTLIVILKGDKEFCILRQLTSLVGAVQLRCLLSSPNGGLLAIWVRMKPSVRYWAKAGDRAGDFGRTTYAGRIRGEQGGDLVDRRPRRAQAFRSNMMLRGEKPRVEAWIGQAAPADMIAARAPWMRPRAPLPHQPVDENFIDLVLAEKKTSNWNQDILYCRSHRRPSQIFSTYFVYEAKAAGYTNSAIQAVRRAPRSAIHRLRDSGMA